MLNPYFSFGVPTFLFLLYVGFAIIRKKSQIHYLGFILLLISAFMTVFSFQVLQGFWSLQKSTSIAELPNILGYNSIFLWLPFCLGVILSAINIIRGIKRVLSFQNDRIHDN